MTNAQAEMTSGEAELMWEEYCYHNVLVDVLEMMQRYGSGKVIMDVIDMYKEAEKIKND